MNFIAKFLKRRAQKRAERLKMDDFISKAIQSKMDADAASAQAEIDRKIIMESSVPWYKLIGEPYDVESPPVKFITERYEWNKAFIDSLRMQGIAGETDTQVISNWEASVAAQKLARLAEIHRDTKRRSDDPWVEVVGEKYDDQTKQVEIKLDWNQAFIKMLRRNGYVGRTESEIIDKWFKQLSADIANDIHGTGYEG